MRALGRPDQFAIPSIPVPVERPYDKLREMQVWVGLRPQSLYAAHWTGNRWFLLQVDHPAHVVFRVTADGSLWAYRDRGFDYRCKMTLEDLAPTGETARRCSECGNLSLRGQNRHSPNCQLH